MLFHSFFKASLWVTSPDGELEARNSPKGAQVANDRAECQMPVCPKSYFTQLLHYAMLHSNNPYATQGHPLDGSQKHVIMPGPRQ